MIDVSEYHIVLTPLQFRILTVISQTPHLSGIALAARIYGHRYDGGPDDAINVIKVTLCNARKRLTRLTAPFRIRGKSGHGYWLE